MASRRPTSMPAATDIRPAGADRRARQSRGHARRDLILAEAVEILAARGFRGTSIAELAKRVGMTHPGLLYYFGSKERLLHEVVSERERMEGAAYYGTHPDSEASLANITEIAQLIADSPTFTRLYVVLAAENLDPGEPLHDFFTDRYARARDLVAAAVRADMARGEVRKGTDPAQIAREVVATLMGREIQWLMDPDEIDYVATIEAFTEGLRARLAP